MKLAVNRVSPLLASTLALALLTGCGMGGGGGKAEPLPTVRSGPAADYPMVVGKPFVIDGITHTPADRMNYDAVGYAALGNEGGSAITASHKTLPLPSYAEVTALDSGKTVLVRLERRGPMANEQLIELSPGAAVQLGFSGSGRVPVRVRRVNPPEAERALLRAGERAPFRMETPKPLLSVLMRKLNPVPLASPSPVATAIPAPVPSPTAKKLPKGKPVPKPSATPTPRPTPAAAPTPRPSPAAKPSPAPSARPSPAAGSHPYYIQAGTFASKTNADAGATKIGGQVIAAGRMWRLRKGPFGSQAEAQAALAKVRSAGYKDARIQRAD